MNGVLGKKCLEFTVKLGGKSLVVGQNKNGPMSPGDDVCRGKGFSAPRNPQEGLELV